MRLVTSISPLALALMLGLWQFYRADPPDNHEDSSHLSRLFSTDTGDDQEIIHAVELILDLERYEDADYGFTMAIPTGWTRIVAADSDIAETDDVLAIINPGYAVGFETPRSGSKDRFADYILLEILPGDETGLFESTTEHRNYIEVGRDSIAYDRLYIDSASDDHVDVDLVIFQRGVQAFGYTLGFYAIGEPANEQTLFDAFQVMLRTYQQTADPFVII